MRIPHRAGSNRFPARLAGLVLLTAGGTVGTWGQEEGRPGSLTEVAVTTLDDHGPGSLREAVAQGDRRVTFAVGGVIRLQAALEVRSDRLVIDANGAPAPGITLRGKPFILRDARKVTLRGLRFRDSNDDNLRITGRCRGILVEQCSSTGAGDGAIDITHDYDTLARPCGVTVQHCLIAATDKAMLVVGADELTLRGNLFTGNRQRNPQLHDAGRFQFVNNLVRDFASYGFRARAGSTGNVVGNLFPISPQRPNRPDRTFLIDHSRGACRIFLRDNRWADGLDLDGLGTVDSPVGTLPDGIRPAAVVESLVLSRAGARPLDRIDSALVDGEP